MIGDTITTVAAALVGIAQLKEGRSHLSDLDDTPRYVWCRTMITPSNRKADAGSLQEDRYDNEVHCWGASYDDVDRMRQALVQAVRSAVGGRNYVEVRSTFSDDATSERGFLLVVQLAIFKQMKRATIATTVPQVLAPSTTVTDTTATEVTIETVEFDTAGAASGDGLLQALET